MEKEKELENLYDVSSIWTTIRTFESIVQNLIEDAVVESAAIERSMVTERKTTTDKDKVTTDPTEVPVNADENQASPSG